MNPQLKAKELALRFSPHVNPYIGSGMLSNSPDDDTILWQAKQCAKICVAEILTICTTSYFKDFWNNVNNEIYKL